MHSSLVILSLAASVQAHIAAWNPGMYCKGGNDSSTDDQNTNLAVNPLYNLDQDVWWQQRDRGCHLVPPPDGEFLDLPAGGSFKSELANNRAFTSLSYDGELVSAWQDGEDRPEPWVGPGNPPACLNENTDGLGGELHTRSQEHAAGTAWAISYESDLDKVTMENLVVFSVRHHTPWKRETFYDVPADLPECPEEGCYCAWLWIPDGCGQSNMYMQNHRCRVTNSNSTRTLGTPKAPVWCEDDQSKCLAGPKQMMAWQQASGNNVEAPQGRTPTYNERMGYYDGAQNDIFADEDEQDQSQGQDETSTPTPTPTPTPSQDEEAPVTTACGSRRRRHHRRHARG